MRYLMSVSLIALSTPVLAEAPDVVADIAPVQSLVAQVMEGVGDPGLLIRPGVSPHGYALRPSEARMLSNADIVVWVGEADTPWLPETLESLAPDARSLELMEVEGTRLLPVREGADFAPHDHDHGHEDDHDHAAGDHDDHDAHAHGGRIDPHVWLDPENARVWVVHLAEVLAEADPENAARYRENAEATAARLAALEGKIQAQIDTLSGEFVTFHDAYQYFETRFGKPAHGALSTSDAVDPGPARVAALHDMVESEGIVCLFAEPQFNPRQVSTLAEDLGVRTGVLDPLGVAHDPGPGHYAALLTGIADGLSACLDGQGD